MSDLDSILSEAGIIVGDNDFLIPTQFSESCARVDREEFIDALITELERSGHIAEGEIPKRGGTESGGTNESR